MKKCKTNDPGFQMKDEILLAWLFTRPLENQNSKKEDLEEEDQRQDERNVIL